MGPSHHPSAHPPACNEVCCLERSTRGDSLTKGKKRVRADGTALPKDSSVKGALTTVKEGRTCQQPDPDSLAFRGSRARPEASFREFLFTEL